MVADGCLCGAVRRRAERGPGLVRHCHPAACATPLSLACDARAEIGAGLLEKAPRERW
jgi:hypothetical protein